MNAWTSLVFYLECGRWSAAVDVGSGPADLNRGLRKDRNFITATLFAFLVGMILYATMALLPELLQGLLG